MISLRLEFSGLGDLERVLKVRPIIFQYLARATVNTLKPPAGAGDVSMKFFDTPGVNVPRVEVIGEVGEGETPAPQDIDLWLRYLRQVWEEMRTDQDLRPIRNIVNGSVAFSTAIRTDGATGFLPAA